MRHRRRRRRAVRTAGIELTTAAVIGVMYVGGGWPDDRDAARRFTAGFGITYPTVVDEGSRLAHAFAIPGIPVTVVADRSGRLAYRILGPVRPGEIDALVSRLSGALP